MPRLPSSATIGRVVHIESYFSFKMVRRTITAVDQVKDILPHAVYPVVEQLRAGTGLADAPIEVVGAFGRCRAAMRMRCFGSAASPPWSS